MNDFRFAFRQLWKTPGFHPRNKTEIRDAVRRLFTLLPNEY